MFVFGYKYDLLEREYRRLMGENEKSRSKEQLLELELKMTRMKVEALLGKDSARKIFESVEDSMDTVRRVHGVSGIPKRG